VPVWLAKKRPETTASVEQMMKAAMRTRATLMPARLVASGLPPTA
jgi:hypothetical protein